MNYNDIKLENYNKIKKYVPDASSGIVSFYPKYIQLEHTNKCNARCIMCNHFFVGNKSASEISDSVIERLRPILPYVQVIMLNGDGEPFLYSNIIKCIEMYSSFGVKIGANTNLSYVPDELWSYFSKSFTFLNISCDGASKEIFELIRRGLNYDDFISNIKKLNSVATGLRKNLDCVVMKQNIAEAPDIVKFAHKYNFASVRFHRLGVNPCIDNRYDSDLFWHAYAKKQMYAAVEVGNELGIHVQVPNYPEAPEKTEFVEKTISEMKKEINIRQIEAMQKYSDLTLQNDYCSIIASSEDFNVNVVQTDISCRWGIERCYIDLKGNVTTCCYNTRKHMGNIVTQTFDEIWNGENYQKFRKMMAQNHLPSWCRNCNWIKNPKF